MAFLDRLSSRQYHDFMNKMLPTVLMTLLITATAHAFGGSSGDGRMMMAQIGTSALLTLEILCFLLLEKQAGRKFSWLLKVAFLLGLILQYLIASFITMSFTSFVLVPLISPFLFLLFGFLIFLGRRLAGRLLILAGGFLLALNLFMTISIWSATGTPLSYVFGFFEDVYLSTKVQMQLHDGLRFALFAPFSSDSRLVILWSLVNALVSGMFVWIIYRRLKRSAGLQHN